ncbi:MAG: hypothetical protein ABIL58_00950 [Pseudomonadota bacterium]
MSQESLNHVVTGALNDFIGFLTSRDERLTLSAADDAAPAVEAVQEFLARRGIAYAPPLSQWESRCDRSQSAQAQTAQAKSGQFWVIDGTTYHRDTPRQVVRALEDARQRSPKPRVRIFLGDTETGRDWLEENDVTGFIGRSMGPVKVPLLLHTRHSDGGGAILDHCIVRLMVDGVERYRHPKYYQPKIERVAPVTEGYAAAYNVDGQLHAQFESIESADRWYLFMMGERATK